MHHLIADPRVRSERLVGIASADEDQSRIIFAQVAQLVDRHPFLKEHVRVFRSEMSYTETARDPVTGGPVQA